MLTTWHFVWVFWWFFYGWRGRGSKEDEQGSCFWKNSVFKSELALAFWPTPIFHFNRWQSWSGKPCKAPTLDNASIWVLFDRLPLPGQAGSLAGLGLHKSQQSSNSSCEIRSNFPEMFLQTTKSVATDWNWRAFQDAILIRKLHFRCSCFELGSRNLWRKGEYSINI